MGWSQRSPWNLEECEAAYGLCCKEVLGKKPKSEWGNDEDKAAKKRKMTAWKDLQRKRGRIRDVSIRVIKRQIKNFERWWITMQVGIKKLQ